MAKHDEIIRDFLYKPLEGLFNASDTLIRNIKFHNLPLSYRLCLTKEIFQNLKWV
jgi:hypothetical protein